MFDEENYYYCINCGQYSCELVNEQEFDDRTVRYYECVCCGELDCEVIY